MMDIKENNRGKRGPDKKPRKRRTKKQVVRVQLSLTSDNAEYLRLYLDSNSNLVNCLLESHRNDKK